MVQNDALVWERKRRQSADEILKHKPRDRKYKANEMKTMLKLAVKKRGKYKTVKMCAEKCTFKCHLDVSDLTVLIM